MRRFLKIMLLFFVVVLLSGCETGRLKCTAKYDDSIKYSVQIKAIVKDKFVTEATARLNFDSKDDAIGMCELKELSSSSNVSIKCYEKEIVIKNYQFLEMTNNVEQISKKDFIKKMENQGFKCK